MLDPHSKIPLYRQAMWETFLSDHFTGEDLVVLEDDEDDGYGIEVGTRH